MAYLKVAKILKGLLTRKKFLLLCMVTDGKQTYCGDHFVVYANIESLCCTPKTNIRSSVNYTSIKKIK